MKKLTLMMFLVAQALFAVAQDGIPTTPLVKIRDMQVLAEFDEVLKEGVNVLNIDAKFCKVDIVACPDTLANTRVAVKLEAMDKEDGYEIINDSKSSELNLTISIPEQSQTAFAGEFIIYLHPTTTLKVNATSGIINVKDVVDGHMSIQTEKGKINIDKSQGVIDVKTIGGPVNIYKCSGEMTVRSSNSMVKVDQSEGTFDLDSGDGALTVNQFKGTIKTTTFGGKQTIDNVEGSLDLNSKGGMVRLTYIVAEMLKVKTLRGDISFGNSIKGVLDISTLSGTISNAQPIMLTGSSKFDSETGRIKVKFGNKKDELAFDVTADTKDAVISVRGTKKKKKLQMGNGNIIVTSHSVRGEQIFS